MLSVELDAELLELSNRTASTISLPFFDWMVRHRNQLIPGRTLDFAEHDYLIGIYKSKAERMAIMKSGQVGISEYLLSWALWCCDMRNATTLYVFPTDRHVSDFSAARLGPALEASPYLRDIVVDAGTRRGKRGSDKVSLKRVRDRFLYFRGGQVKPDGNTPGLKSVDADCLVLDEYAELDARAPIIARKRLGHSLIAEERSASTPTYPGYSIHAEWLESTKQTYHFRCHGCGNRQDIAIGDIVIEWDALGRPVAWYGQSEGRAFAACRRCQKEIDRTQKGEWVAESPERALVGYHVTKLISPRIPLLSIVKALDTTDGTKQKEAWNQDLGLPHKPSGSGLNETELDDAQRDYAHGPRKDIKCFMGVDVGKVLNVVVRAAQDGETGERAQLYAGEVVSFDELAQLIRQYGPAVVVIDALPETRKVRELQSEFRRRKIWIAYYVTQAIGNKKKTSAEWHRKDGKVTVDRTRVLDEMVGRFLDGENTLPANAPSIKNYYNQMKSSVRVIDTRPDGTQIAKWIETGADHFMHAEAYCHVASCYKSISAMSD